MAPTTYDYRDKTDFLQPKLGNTVTLLIADFVGEINETDIGVYFRYYNFTSSEEQNIEAVYCSDMYSEQIEAENNGTWSTKYFTDTFDDIGEYWKKVCPKIDIIDNVQYTFRAYISSCKVAKENGATYAAN